MCKKLVDLKHNKQKKGGKKKKKKLFGVFFRPFGCFMSALSNKDVLFHIFRFLDCSSLYAVGGVCRLWRTVSSEAALWELALRRELTLTEPEWKRLGEKNRSIWKQNVLLASFSEDVDRVGNALTAAIPPGMNCDPLQLLMVVTSQSKSKLKIENLGQILNAAPAKLKGAITPLTLQDIEEEVQNMASHHPAYGGGFNDIDTSELERKTIQALAGPCNPSDCQWGSGDCYACGILGEYWADFYGFVYVCLRADGRTVHVLAVSDTD